MDLIRSSSPSLITYLSLLLISEVTERDDNQLQPLQLLLSHLGHWKTFPLCSLTEILQNS